MCDTPPSMPEKEARAWVDLLAPTLTGQIKVLRSLVQHANGDRMTNSDRTICRKQLVRLETERRQILNDDLKSRLRKIYTFWEGLPNARRRV